ncbi:hypothetical protein N9M41_05940 [Rhodopirellula sp.]|nr:hypothetical protein [Rhodopirellula sp.]
MAIIGSGHAAMSAARGLVQRGFQPTIIDVGELIEPSRQQIIDRLSNEHQENWQKSDLQILTENKTVHTARPVRLAFGSDYVYGRNRPWNTDELETHGPSPTFAKGGYSTVWGGAMLPAETSDLTDWPIESTDLSRWYGEVLKTVPLAAEKDDLINAFPLHGEPDGVLPRQPIVDGFLRDLSKKRFKRTPETLAFGSARLAVRAGEKYQAQQCTSCGRCLSGCVYGSIYSALDDLKELSAKNSISYIPGVVVEKLEEKTNGIYVLGRRLDGDPFSKQFDHVFLAAGAISSTRILMRSARIFNHELKMQTTQGFVVPMLRVRHTRYPWPNTTTLTGMFLEVKLPQVSPHWMHCQISQANELVLAKLNYSGSKSLLDRIKRRALGHLLIGLCNVHSKDAAHYGIKLSAPDKTSANGTMTMSTHPSADYSNTSKKLGRHLLKLLAPVGVIPLLPLKHGNPDKPIGWHFGGSLPMRDRPTEEWETDIYGRPSQWKRLSIVDSSVFPSLPSTTIALLAMSNARRIATSVPIQ